jgi:hypothetical protein
VLFNHNARLWEGPRMGPFEHFAHDLRLSESDLNYHSMTVKRAVVLLRVEESE